jgi:hypothetical protein
LLYSFLHPPVTPSLFGPNILLSTMLSNTLSLCHTWEDNIKTVVESDDSCIWLTKDKHHNLNFVCKAIKFEGSSKVQVVWTVCAVTSFERRKLFCGGSQLGMYILQILWIRKQYLVTYKWWILV